MGLPMTGSGTLLQHGVAGTPIVYTTVSDRVSVDGPGIASNDIDGTDLDSAAMEYTPGLPDMGELTLTLNFKPGSVSHQLMFSLAANPVLEPWQLQFPDGTKFPFDAYVKSFKVSGMAVNEKITAEVGLKLSGTIVPVYAP
jgi:hypothetical protein